MYWYRRQRKAKRRSTVTKHYTAHKETAREVIVKRLQYWNTHYNYTYNRVAIRNQSRCWGSCSAKGNLNFSYKLLFLPPCLSDYIIVHELCHLKELNHSKRFWDLLGEAMPDYKTRQRELKCIEKKVGTAVVDLEKATTTHSCPACPVS